jgi:hypothetical protein
MNLLIKLTVPFIVLLFTSCSAQEKNDNAVFEVEYKAQTRGSLINIDFKGDSIVLKSTTEDKTIVLSNAQVNDINSIVSKIKLSEIQNLAAPTNKRFTDGALHGHFSIKKNDTSYTSSDFDHGSPPKELQTLYNIFQKYVK